VKKGVNNHQRDCASNIAPVGPAPAASLPFVVHCCSGDAARFSALCGAPGKTDKRYTPPPFSSSRHIYFTRGSETDSSFACCCFSDCWVLRFCVSVDLLFIFIFLGIVLRAEYWSVDPKYFAGVRSLLEHSVIVSLCVSEKFASFYFHLDFL